MKTTSKLHAIAAATAMAMSLMIAPVATSLAAPGEVGGLPPVGVPNNPQVIPANTPVYGCEFDFQYFYTGKASTITLPGGRFIFTSPKLYVTLTNLSNGNKVTLNITGALHQSTDSDGNVTTLSTGRSLLGDPTTGLVLAIGSYFWTFDSAGNLVQTL